MLVHCGARVVPCTMTVVFEGIRVERVPPNAVMGPIHEAGASCGAQWFVPQRLRNSNHWHKLGCAICLIQMDATRLHGDLASSTNRISSRAWRLFEVQATRQVVRGTNRGRHRQVCPRHLCPYVWRYDDVRCRSWFVPADARTGAGAATCPSRYPSRYPYENGPFERMTDHFIARAGTVAHADVRARWGCCTVIAQFGRGKLCKWIELSKRTTTNQCVRSDAGRRDGQAGPGGLGRLTTSGRVCIRPTSSHVAPKDLPTLLHTRCQDIRCGGFSPNPRVCGFHRSTCVPSNAVLLDVRLLHLSECNPWRER